MISEALGWIGAIAFSICAIPQAIRCRKQGNGDGISSAFLWIWLIGEISMLIAIPMQFGFILWLMMNYIGNTIALVVIMKYKFFPRKG